MNDRPSGSSGPISFLICVPEVFSSKVRVLVFLIFAVMPVVQVVAQSPAVKEADLAHFGDVIDLDVIGSFEFDWRGKLNPEGYLDGMNTYGDPIYGLCRSESEIASAAAKVLSKNLRDPQIKVRIIDRSNRAVVTLDGAVRSPQRFQLRRAVRLQELLVLAGGISDDASGEIQIFRPPHLNCFDRAAVTDDGKPLPVKTGEVQPLIVVSIQDLLKGSADANLPIRSGDLVTVLRAVPIYVIGGVSDPRPILSRPGLTLSRAIAVAGGVSKEGAKSSVSIYRTTGNSVSVIKADLAKIEANTADDPLVLPLDIIEVAQKNGPERKFPPVVRSASPARPAVLPLRIVE